MESTVCISLFLEDNDMFLGIGGKDYTNFDLKLVKIVLGQKCYKHR